jgi:hypothetical protein
MNDLQLNQLFTYQLITEIDDDDDDDRDDDREDDDTDISKMLYQIQLLELFNLKELNFDGLNDKIDIIYSQLKNDTLIKELFEIHPYKEYMTHELMFRTFFSYDYLYLFHKYLYHSFSKNIITNHSDFYIQLKNKLMSK